QTALADGPYTLRLAISDRSGNTGTLISTYFLDAKKPVVTLQPSENAILTTATPTLIATFADESPSSSIDVGSFVGLVDAVDHSASFTVSSTQAVHVVPPQSALAEGGHVFIARISDRSGNSGESSSSFLVDTRPPQIAIVSPSEGATLPTTTPLFEISFADPEVGSGLALTSFKGILDQQQDITSAFTVTATGATYQVPAGSPLAAGEHQLSVEIADRGGLKATAQVSFTLIIPPSGPTGTIVGKVITGDGCTPEPLAGALVKIVHGTTVVRTDAAGRFVMPAPIGNVWLQIEKAGYLLVQRSIRVIQGRESALPTVYLAKQDPKSTRVVAGMGGTVTDSTGNITLELPPGALPQDMDVVLTMVTDRRASKGPPMPMFIPGLGARITPEFVRLNVPATLKIRNLANIPMMTIFGFDWNLETQAWDRTPDAVVTPDLAYLQMTIDHFSQVWGGCHGAKKGGGNGNGISTCDGCCAGPAPASGGGPCAKGYCEGGQGQPGSPKIVYKTGALVEGHDLVPIRSRNTSRSLRFVYSSQTANPERVIPTTFERENPVTGIRVTATAGAQFSETYYTPTTGTIFHGFYWNALDSQGRKLPTGVYPVRVSGHFAETATIEGSGASANVEIETDVHTERFVGIQNNSESPFGSGWWLSELDRLIVEPTGNVLWAGGDGSVTVFQPGYYSEPLAGAWIPGFAGDGGPASQALFNAITDVVYDKQGNLFVLDSGNVRVRRISTDGIVTTVAGNGQVGRGPDGVPGTSSPLATPTAITVDPDGNLYIAEGAPSPRIRKVDLSGTITTAVSKDPMEPMPIPPINNMVFDPKSSTFITVDRDGSRIYRIHFDASFEPVAGVLFSAGYSGDNGLAINAKLNQPSSVALGPSGEIYICDSQNQRIRVVEPNGIIRTFAGTGRSEYPRDGRTATLSDLYFDPPVSGIALTPEGELLIAETGNRLIRKVAHSGMMYTVAGTPAPKLSTEIPSGPALGLLIDNPWKIAVGPHGEVAFTAGIHRAWVPLNYIPCLKLSKNGEVTYTRTVGSFAQLTRHADGTFTQKDLDGTLHEYSAQGLKLARIDPGGLTTRYTYAGNLLESIIEPTGQTWTFSYSGGKLASVTDAAGRVTLFDIGSTGDLLAITDPDGKAVRYGYDNVHRMTSETSTLGSQFTATYSSMGQVVKTEEPDGGIRRFIPQDSLSLADDLPTGHGTKCEAAPFIRPDGIYTTYIDARSGIWRFTLDDRRQIVKEVDPQGRATTRERNEVGLVTTMTRSNGTKVLTTYDNALGRVLSTEDTAIQVGGHNAVIRYEYSSAHPTIPTTITDAMGNVSRSVLDAAGRPLVRTDAEGHSDVTTYNNLGLVIAETDKNGCKTTRTYDSNGNEIRLTHPDQSFVETTYTPEGFVASSTDEERRKTEMTYTPAGLVLTKKNAQDGVRRFEYNADRLLIATVDELGRRREMSYNSMRRLIRSVSSTGRVQTTDYDQQGNVTATTDAKLRTTVQEYNANNQLIRRIQPGNVITAYEYGGSGGCSSCQGGLLGLLTKVINPMGGETLYSHDASGRTTEITDPAGGKIRLTLDANGNVVIRLDPDALGTFTTYDRLSRAIGITDPRTGSVTRVYDPNGRIVRETNARGQVTEREYDCRGRLIRITIDATGCVPATTKFEYDKVGNMVTLIPPRGNTRSTPDYAYAWRFQYDSLNRLVKETDPRGRSAVFEYDKVGNLIYKRDRKGQETRYEYNDENEKTAIIYHDGSRVDITYDETGQITSITDSRVTIKRTYDELDRLKTFQIPQLALFMEM
ncbi:MAG: hypothetical protein AB1793_09465, partial [Candidatus Thermoplasmatota archaeon]